MSHRERGRGTEETSIESLSLSSIEFSVGLIVFSKDSGSGHINIVSPRPLYSVRLLLFSSASPLGY